MRARLPLRLARSTAFSVVCVTLAALGHRLADGSGPRPEDVLSGGGAVLAAALLLSGRERSPTVIGGFLIAAQLFLHELFVSGGPSVSAGGTGGWLVHLAHGQGLSVSLGMIVAHLTASVLTAWWLARGETALWSLLRVVGTIVLRRMRILLLLLGDGPAAPRRPFPRPRGHSTRTNARWALRHSVIRRGPPLLASF